MSTAASARSDRYGGPIIAPRTARILAVIGGIVMLAIVVFVGVRYADQPVTAKVVSYEHLAADRLGVTLQVTKPPRAAGICTVQAMNKGAAQVGFVEVEIPASSARQVAQRVEIATQGEAVSAEVLGCREKEER